MKKARSIAVIILFLMITFPNVTIAQSSSQLDILLRQLKSADWSDREKAASELTKLPSGKLSDKVMKALIDELEKESYNKHINEGETEYFSWLFDAISDMRDDRAFTLFIKIGDPTALVKYGDKGIEAIINKTRSKKTCNEKGAPVQVLAEVLAQNRYGYDAKGNIRNNIKNSLIEELGKSKQPSENTEWFKYRARECAYVRINIVRGLMSLAETGDMEVIPIIKSLANEDPYYLVPKGGTQKGTKRYDVRNEALKALQKLKTDGIIK